MVFFFLATYSTVITVKTCEVTEFVLCVICGVCMLYIGILWAVAVEQPSYSLGIFDTSKMTIVATSHENITARGCIASFFSPDDLISMPGNRFSDPRLWSRLYV